LRFLVFERKKVFVRVDWGFGAVSAELNVCGKKAEMGRKATPEG
jgi:hypothetical protein